METPHLPPTALPNGPAVDAAAALPGLPVANGSNPDAAAAALQVLVRLLARQAAAEA